MRAALEQILLTYGQTVRAGEDGESWRAFVQPITGRSRESRLATPLGDVDQRQWLYIGPAGRRLEREQVLLCQGTRYWVRECVTEFLGDEPLYCRAVLEIEKESAV